MAKFGGYAQEADTRPTRGQASNIWRSPAGTAVIQCKFYSRPVGYDVVKEAYTTKAIYHATAALVVSNDAFTTQARKAARQLGVTLAHHAKIAGLLGTTVN